MLPHKYRLRVKADAGLTLTITVRVRRFKLNASGALVFEDPDVAEISAASVADGATHTSAPIANSGTLYLGFHAEFRVTTPATAPTGNKQAILYLLRSVDGGTTFDTTDAHVLSVIPVTAASTTYSQTAEVPV
mgnify:CR=1 FL=1